MYMGVRPNLLGMYTNYDSTSLEDTPNPNNMMNKYDVQGSN